MSFTSSEHPWELEVGSWALGVGRWALGVGDSTMRRAVLPVISLLLLASVNNRAQTEDAAVRQLAPGVYSRQGDRLRRQPANTSWVEFRDFVVVIEANT